MSATPQYRFVVVTLIWPLLSRLRIANALSSPSFQISGKNSMKVRYDVTNKYEIYQLII